MDLQHGFKSPSAAQVMLNWAPPITWAAAIFLASSQPHLQFIPDGGLDFVVRKLGHMAVFGILALLLWFALARTTWLRWPWAWAAALTIVYAFTDELHQGLVVGRHASAVDVAIDAAGAIIAIGVGLAVVRQRSRKRQVSGT